MNKADRIIAALDTSSLDQAKKWVDELRPSIRHFKIGSQLFTACGKEAVDAVHASGARVFLDLKYHDIPSTVARAVEAARDTGVWMLNVHASGGRKMMQSAAEAAKKHAGKEPFYLIAVTVLTSLEDVDLAETGVAADTEVQVLRLARLARASGIHGVVASAREASMIKKLIGPDFLVITPGVRPAWAGCDDQARILEPKQAFEAGADYLVIGRPLTGARRPKEASERLLSEL